MKILRISKIAIYSVVLGVGMILAAPAYVAASPESGGSAMKMERMKEMRAEMQAQMKEIMATEDPEKRQQLLDEHMRSMQGMMQHMHGMHGASSMQELNSRLEAVEEVIAQMLENQQQAERTKAILQSRHKHKR